jgi:muramoyltetrapeptide carboxypeptidase
MVQKMELFKPKLLEKGDTLGVFTPSTPGYAANSGLFENGIRNLEALGFRVKLGSVTASGNSQGYRSASPRDRANELMELIEDSSVHGVISTIGGNNSSSLIPYLDFQKIREAKKVFCGYSDVTSLHLAILKYSGLQTFYGPAVMCWFGEWPNGVEESTDWFLNAVMRERSIPRNVLQPNRWSDCKRRWDNEDWKNLPRMWNKNSGWKVLREGSASAEILAFNLNTLLTSAGTDYWPDLKNRILLIEQMNSSMAIEERLLMQLKFLGVFKNIKGLIVSKPEVFDSQNAPFEYEQLLCEIAGEDFSYPVVTHFDCGHTVPMLTIPQLAKVNLECKDGEATFRFE